MADNQRTEILAIKLDSAGALKEITDIGIELRRVAEKRQELTDAFKRGEKTEREYVQGMAELKAQTTALTNQQNAYQRTLNAHEQLVRKNTGSLEDMRAELSGLTAQYSKLSKEERENKEIGGAMLEQMKALSDELKVQEAAYGQTGRNVGNYTQGILAAVDGTGLVAAITEKAGEAQQAFNATLTITKAGLGGNISLLKLFKLALAATGIGLVVLALSGMVAYLTKTQEGIDFVNRKTKALQIVFGVLTDKLSAVGKILFESFSNPKQALVDLVNFIGNNLLNRVKAFVVIWDALRNRDFNKLQDGVTQLAFGVTDASSKIKKLAGELSAAAKAGEQIEAVNQRIRDSERALNVERSKARAEIEKLKFIAEDTNRSTDARIAATTKAFNLEKKFLDESLKLQRQKIANIEAEQKLTNTLTEGNDLLAEEKMKLAELEENSYTRQVELNNKLNSIRKEAADKAAADAAAKKEAEEKAIAIKF